ncbi:hypothetical protein ACFYKT_05275 [Cytobacillus sp. FJAT-53684]|uniref:Uncharacterized protein n=1 Tax=Cytobacillus mangrovibacter TaxID=3299024 RepID=A0ABW6JV60_9BACI
MKYTPANPFFFSLKCLTQNRKFITPTNMKLIPNKVKEAFGSFLPKKAHAEKKTIIISSTIIVIKNCLLGIG